MAATATNLDIVIRVQDEASAALARMNRSLADFAAQTRRVQTQVQGAVQGGAGAVPGGGAGAAQAARQAAHAGLQADRQAFAERERIARQAYQAQAQASRQSHQAQMQASRQAHQAQMQAFRTQAGGAQSAASAVKELRSSLLGLAAAALSLRALSNAIRDVVSEAVKLEGLRAVFDFISKDTGGSAEVLGFLRKEAERLGVSFNAVADGYKRMASAAEGSSASVDQIRTLFMGVIEASRVFRLSQQDTMLAIRPLTQMLQSQTMQADELRNEFGNRIPGAMQMVVEASNGAFQSVGELFKAMDEGKIKGQAVIDILTNLGIILRRNFSGAAQQAAHATDAEFNRFLNTVQQLQQELGKQLLPALGEITRAFTELIKSTSGATEQMGSMGEFLKGLAVVVMGVATAFSFLGKLIAGELILFVEFMEMLDALKHWDTNFTFAGTKAAFEDLKKTITDFYAFQEKLFSGGYAAPEGQVEQPQLPGLGPVTLPPEKEKRKGKTDEEKEAERIAKAQEEFQKNLAEQWARATMSEVGFFRYKAQELQFTKKEVAELTGYYERMRVDEIARELTDQQDILLRAMDQRISLQEAEQELALERVATEEEQIQRVGQLLIDNEKLTREYQKQNQAVEALKDLEDSLVDTVDALELAAAKQLTVEEAMQELLLTRVAKTEEERQAIADKLALNRELTEEAERQNELIQHNRQLIKGALQDMDLLLNPVRPRARSRQEAYEQRREDMVRAQATDQELFEFDKGAKARLELETMNDVLEGLRDTAEGLGDTLEESLLDVLSGAAASAEGLKETMEGFGKGLVQLFGKEIINLGLKPLRKALDDLAQELMKSEMIKKIINWGVSLIGGAATSSSSFTSSIGGDAPLGLSGDVSGGFLSGMGGGFTPRAHGAIFSSPVLTPTRQLLAEAAPEAVVPLTEGGIERFTRGLTIDMPGMGEKADHNDIRRLEEVMQRAMAHQPPIELTVVLNNVLDPRKLGMQPDEIVHIVAKNVQEDGVLRRVISRNTTRQ